MRWWKDSLDARIFLFLLDQAGCVTVLGQNQRARLIELGIPSERIRILVNSCELEPLPIERVTAKHASSQGPLRCLFLSSLIDSKGFPEFLEALELLQDAPGRPIEAVLCGRVLEQQSSGRFESAQVAETWIREKLEQLNLGSRVHATWIRGAVGQEKAELFRRAHIFVLPTSYAVEAQPLVLLEAMASGCAIVTTRVGEITTILDESCAVLIETPNSGVVASQIQSLAHDDFPRACLAEAAHRRYIDQFGRERHWDRWEQLLSESPSS